VIEIIAIVLATAVAIVLQPAFLAFIALCLGREIHAEGQAQLGRRRSLRLTVNVPARRPPDSGSELSRHITAAVPNEGELRPQPAPKGDGPNSAGSGQASAALRRDLKSGA
jgi:hypothetical protein